MKSAIVLLALLSAATAWAGPPYLTDDPEPVEYRHWEIYLFAAGSSIEGGSSGVAPAIEANYGPFEDAQLLIALPFAFDAPSEGPRHHGFGDLLAGFKYRFVHETDGRPQLAVYPQVAAPTGASGLGSEHWRFYFPLLVQKSYGPWTIYGGPGWWRNPGAGNRDFWTMGLLVQRQLGERWSVGAEVYGEGADAEGGRSTRAIAAGFIHPLNERFAVIGSAGRVTGGESGYEAYVALRFTR